jgi:hypothetical protein
MALVQTFVWGFWSLFIDFHLTKLWIRTPWNIEPYYVDLNFQANQFKIQFFLSRSNSKYFRPTTSYRCWKSESKPVNTFATMTSRLRRLSKQFQWRPKWSKQPLPRMKHLQVNQQQTQQMQLASRAIVRKSRLSLVPYPQLSVLLSTFYSTIELYLYISYIYILIHIFFFGFSILNIFLIFFSSIKNYLSFINILILVTKFEMCAISCIFYFFRLKSLYIVSFFISLSLFLSPKNLIRTNKNKFYLCAF